MFRDAERSSDLLRFVVDAALRDESDQLKETYIAVSVFGRDASYDPKVDPIVRVQAGRLRTKLTSYYSGPGITSAVRIDVPKGSYKPQFVFSDLKHLPEGSTFPLQRSFIPLAPSPEVERTPSSLRRRRLRLSIAAAVVLATIGVLSWASLTRGKTLKFDPPVPVATSRGHNMQASLSPDGQRFVYAWTDGKSSANLYVADISGQSRTRITTDASQDLRPSWSPDGRDIAFLRVALDHAEVVLKPLYSQSETVLGVLQTPLNLWSEDPSFITYAPGPVWTRDGQSLLVTDNPDGKGFGLFLWSLASGERKRLTTPPNGEEDIYPTPSPDRTRLAFVRWTSSGSGDIYVATADGRKPARLTFDSRDIQGLVWAPDGRSIVFSSFRTGEHHLWRIPGQGGESTLVPVNGRDQTEPATSADGKTLLYTENTINTAIWQAPINKPNSPADAGREIIDSTRRNDNPQYSPDGKSIVFQSYRTGERQLWIAASDGTNPRQLTHYSANVPLGGPHWSPDGKQIAFYALVGEHKQIFVVDVKTGSIARLITDNSEDRSPNWSSDGRSIYFNSNRDGVPGCWKDDLATKTVSKIATHLCWDNFESPDGKTLYFVTVQPGIWQVDLRSGAEKVVPHTENVRIERYIAAVKRGIYFVDYEDRTNKIYFLDTSSGQLRVVGSLDGQLAHWEHGMSISPDETHAIYTREDESLSEIDAIRQR